VCSREIGDSKSGPPEHEESASHSTAKLVQCGRAASVGFSGAKASTAYSVIQHPFDASLRLLIEQAASAIKR
jgi:hypothetical protein